MAKKKCRLCPYAAVCTNECYDPDGLTPCEHALKYDKMAKQLQRKDNCIKALTERLGVARAGEQVGSIVHGDYVLSGHKNAFNAKTSWWLSKKGCTVAVYCFTTTSPKEVEYQISCIDGYIKMLDGIAGGEEAK